MHRAFEWLPIASLVGGAVLVLHGGIGDGAWGLRELRGLSRPLSNEFGTDVHRCVLQALWSDPTESDASMERGVHPNPARGHYLIPKFGHDVTAAFCAREGVELVVRSHQFVREGVKFMHNGRLVCVFSARNYFDREQNDSALLLVAPDEADALRVHTKRLAHRVGPCQRCD